MQPFYNKFTTNGCGGPGYSITDRLKELKIIAIAKSAGSLAVTRALFERKNSAEVYLQRYKSNWPDVLCDINSFDNLENDGTYFLAYTKTNFDRWICPSRSGRTQPSDCNKSIIEGGIIFLPFSSNENTEIMPPEKLTGTPKVERSEVNRNSESYRVQGESTNPAPCNDQHKIIIAQQIKRRHQVMDTMARIIGEIEAAVWYEFQVKLKHRVEYQ